jgi:N-acetylmuramoyl-L-alanine amidase
VLAAAAGGALVLAGSALAGACDPARFRVVVDVGHTAEVPGATSARGVPEYAFNLGLGREIEAALVGGGFKRTMLLVTSGPAARGLALRAERANRAGANLLLSVHHDSVPEQFLETWEPDGKPNRYSDRFSGHSIFVSYDNRFPRESLRFGSLLGARLKARGLRYTPHYTQPFMGRRRRELLDSEAGVYRFDALKVLHGVEMPAALLEAGSIVNRADEATLATPDRQRLIAAAATEAVAAFCATMPDRRGRE